MFSTQQLKLRNQVAEIRSMLPEFAEEDRPDILEVIQKLVSKFKYTFPEDIWIIIKEYALDHTRFEWMYHCPKFIPILPTQNFIPEYEFELPKSIYFQNYKPLRNVVRSDLKVGMMFYRDDLVCVITKIGRVYLHYIIVRLTYGMEISKTSLAKRLSATRLNLIDFHYYNVSNVKEDFKKWNSVMRIDDFLEVDFVKFIDKTIPLLNVIGLAINDRSNDYHSVVDYGMKSMKYHEDI